jgi:hypothetical protein
MHRSWRYGAALALVLATAAGAAQPARQEGSTLDQAQDIATQPARDIGVERIRVPPLLAEARADPYSLTGLRTCRQLAEAIDALDEVLGPDFDSPSEAGGTRAGRMAAAGGRAIVNSLIPFRGVVRELTGSAAADRRLNDAVDAGLARRGFLRGIRHQRGCRR